jgi:hypothetical protein
MKFGIIVRAFETVLKGGLKGDVGPLDKGRDKCGGTVSKHRNMISSLQHSKNRNS